VTCCGLLWAFLLTACKQQIVENSCGNPGASHSRDGADPESFHQANHQERDPFGAIVLPEPDHRRSQTQEQQEQARFSTCSFSKAPMVSSATFCSLMRDARSVCRSSFVVKEPKEAFERPGADVDGHGRQAFGGVVAKLNLYSVRPGLRTLANHEKPDMLLDDKM